MSLAIARNEGCGLRCLNHGWLINADGEVHEMPADPNPADLMSSVRQIAYPTAEAGGYLWAFLGDEENLPPLPNFEWMGLPVRIATTIGY